MLFKKDCISIYAALYVYSEVTTCHVTRIFFKEVDSSIKYVTIYYVYIHTQYGACDLCKIIFLLGLKCSNTLDYYEYITIKFFGKNIKTLGSEGSRSLPTWLVTSANISERQLVIWLSNLSPWQTVVKLNSKTRIKLLNNTFVFQN